MKRFIFIPLTLIVLLITFLFYFLDLWGIIQIERFLPALNNQIAIRNNSLSTDIEMEKIAKREQNLIEKEEKILQEVENLKKKEEEVQAEIDQVQLEKENLNFQREQLEKEKKFFADRKKNIEDLATKITNMPPEKAREMMENWDDYDIIDVIRQIDMNAEEEGVNSITPYLLSIFDEERRSTITSKMLQEDMDQ